MSNDYFKKKTQDILAIANVRINGSRPWDIKVHNDAFYQRILSGGSLAVGESYMDGWWSCNRLDEFFSKVFKAELETKISNWKFLLYYLKAKFLNLQNKSRAFYIGKAHYDIGNEIYTSMLDSRMTYTCGYWKNASTLDEAQEAKLDLVCRKIGLQKGMKVLDIGCGWGSFAKYAAEKYKIKVVGITVSKEQLMLARKLCRGLPIEIRLQDYRDVREKFDRIISLGMFEHVGCKNYRTYMKVAHQCLNENGLFLLHTIGRNNSIISNDPWIEKYIFPNSVLPSIKQIGAAIEGLFVMEDWHNFGADYDKTLMAWFKNFDTNWNKLKFRYNERFYKMWKFYLLACAGTFRARKNQLWQIVLSKKGVPGGYVLLRDA